MDLIIVIFIIVGIAIFVGFLFMPVQFHIKYQKTGRDDYIVFELSCLGGMIKRQKIIDFVKVGVTGVQQESRKKGVMFFWKNTKRTREISPFDSGMSGFNEFLERYRHYGLGVTLLSYFIPAKYQSWILVTEDLERRGYFTQFIWRTQIGTGEAASTSIIYGGLWGIKAGIINLLNQKTKFRVPPEIQIIPDFQNVRLDMLFDSIFRIKLGYIIIASGLARIRRYGLKGGVEFERASD